MNGKIETDAQFPASLGRAQRRHFPVRSIAWLGRHRPLHAETAAAALADDGGD